MTMNCKSCQIAAGNARFDITTKASSRGIIPLRQDVRVVIEEPLFNEVVVVRDPEDAMMMEWPDRIDAFLDQIHGGLLTAPCGSQSMDLDVSALPSINDREQSLWVRVNARVEQRNDGISLVFSLIERHDESTPGLLVA